LQKTEAAKQQLTDLVNNMNNIFASTTSRIAKNDEDRRKLFEELRTLRANI
jgi:hypothetical protein